MRANAGQSFYEVSLIKMIFVENLFLRSQLHESVAFLHRIIVYVPASRPLFWIPSGFPFAKDLLLSMFLRSERIVL